MTVRALRPQDDAALDGRLAFAHLVACLREAVRALDAIGMDVDARIVEAHIAALCAGREWPGMPITAPDLDGDLAGADGH
jgi:hypothetical protein